LFQPPCHELACQPDPLHDPLCEPLNVVLWKLFPWNAPLFVVLRIPLVVDEPRMLELPLRVPLKDDEPCPKEVPSVWLELM
jgi:hypothetical protein